MAQLACLIVVVAQAGKSEGPASHLSKESCAVGQVELKAEQIQLIGRCDVSQYPLQKKRHTLEFLREIAHLRPRTNTIGKHPELQQCSYSGLFPHL